MGKTAKQSPPQSKMSKTKHKHSHNISRNKKHRKLKKEFKLKRKSIQQLFTKLKNQGVAKFQNDSVIFHDVDYHNTPPIKNKRKHSVIIIDDELTITEEKKNKTSTPVCSTPCKGKQTIITIDEPSITAIDKPIIETIVEPTVEPTIETIVEPTIKTTVEPTIATIVQPTTSIIDEPTIKTEDKPIIIAKINEVLIPISSTPNKNDNNTELNKDLNISNVSVANINNNLDIINLNNDDTKEINRDSYFTIDLTTESNSFANAENTVIDLDKLDTDCSFLSANSSMSGDSEVTVIRASLKRKKDIKNDTKMRKFAEGIAQLDATEKGRLLSLITENIFNGCKMPEAKKPEVIDVETYTRAPDTAEDTYIKEMILGQKASRNSIGSNIYNPVRHMNNRMGLRMVVIDGSNVAMEHGMGRIFSVRGLKICIDFFLKRGHTVKAFVPRFRCKYGKSSLPKLLDELERRGYVVFTPSREVRGRQITSYDDRYIIQCAAEFEGVIVSGDNYRDLMQENPRWRQVIETRLLQFTWVHDMIMFPKDPLGRNGPTLEQFLRH